MKAKELAQILLQYPDHDVLVDGYEAGYEDLKTVVLGKVIEHYHSEDYYGPHELLREAGNTVENQTVKEALILKRTTVGHLAEQAFEKVLHLG